MVRTRNKIEWGEEQGSQLSVLLQNRLDKNKRKLRPNQIQTIKKLVRTLERGVFQGLIKQPTGAGKTRLFGEILKALHLPSLVLVPRSNLIEQTKKELLTVGYANEEVIGIEPKGVRGAVNLVKKAIENISKQANGHVIVMTYQSFLSIAKKKEVLEDLLAQMKVVISDEAHRSLGEQTKERLRNIDEMPMTEIKKTRKRLVKKLQKDSEGAAEDEMPEEFLTTEESAEIEEILEEENEERKIEAVTKQHSNILHLRLTATPRLAEKDVQEVFGIEVIDWIRIQQLVEDGTLILPQLIEVGTATYALEEDQEKFISDSYLSQVAEQDRFRMEDGRTVSEANTDEYIRAKERCGGTLRAVAFCGTVAQSQKYLEYVSSRGVDAVRVTSASGEYDAGTSADEAKKILEEGKIDMVITVSKVGEGWDVPVLSCAIWNVPTNSPARSLQGNGRIMRNMKGKNRSNTFIIEPNWLINRLSPEKFEDKDQTQPLDENQERKRERGLYESKNFFERLLELDEIDVEALQKMGITIEKKDTIDLMNDDQLRILIDSVDSLIESGRGINLQNKQFVCAEKKWSVSGRQIGYARWENKNCGMKEAEKLARILWPKEAAERILDLKNNHQLALLIGSINHLVEAGRGVNLLKKHFECPERGWKVSGSQIGYARWGKLSPGSVEAEELARILWPKESVELLPNEKLDLMNDDHLRLLIGSVHALIENGKGVSLQRMEFKLPERNWSIRGYLIGKARLGTRGPGSAEAEKLARILWPKEAAELLPDEKLDLMNDDHLRLLIGSANALIKDGNGVGLSTKNFEFPKRRWSVSGNRIGTARWGKNSPGSAEAEELARILWPKEVAELLPKEKLDPMNDDHLRLLIGSVHALIENGKGVYLQRREFEFSERRWSANGTRISRTRLGKNSPGSTEAEELARILWPKEAEFFLLDLNNDDHLRELIGSVDQLIELGRGRSLPKKQFVCIGKKWNVTGNQIGFARFGKYGLSSSESEELARQLWPKEAKQLLGKKQ